MKNKYLAVQGKKGELYLAYVITVTTSDNLVKRLEDESIISANICNSRKEANKLVDVWNQGFKEKGVCAI